MARLQGFLAGGEGLLGLQEIDAGQRSRIDACVEHAALAELAGGDDVAAHQAGEIAADGEPEARATELARGRAVGLGEWIEYRFHLVRRDTDAVVHHVDGEARLVTGRAHVQNYFDAAFIGKLDGVGDQVGDDLAQARGIAEHLLGDRSVDFHSEKNAFLFRLDQQRFDDFAGEHVRGELQALDLHAPGLDLGKIENVVDELQQVLAARVNGVQVLAALLHGLGIAAPQDIGKAEDGVHGRADLVAHVGQEVTLRLVCGLGGFSGFLQLADVVEAHQGAAGLVAAAEHR